MALSASATSVLPAWDETIVPVLRKRLENESRILTKRMSIASIVSADNTPRSDTPTKSSYISREQRATPAHAADPRKTSAIPRPSLHHTRSTQDSPAGPSAGSSSLNRTSPPGVTPQRSRTYSQPHSQDFTSPNGNANGSTLSASSDSRPTSPRTNDARPTRIPIATRNRTTSVSSHAQSIAPRAESRNGIFPGAYPSPNPDSSPDLYVLQEANLPPLSLRHQRSNLMNEPPPFSASSITSSLRSQEHLPTPREPKFSTDSEERPFEHWYRGDVHRNGGVGELRVAKHMEMLQIANFGHSIRQPLRSQTSPDYNRKRMRAESLSVGGRGSLCLDDDERAQGVDMVLDESPLTDIEADSDTDVETFYDAYMGNADEPIRSSFNVSMPMLPLSVAADTKNEASVVGHEPHLEDINPALVPMARAVSELRRPDTPPVRESTIPTPPPTVPRSQAVSRATSPVSQISVQSQARRRTKSPARPSPASTPKGSSKAKAKTPPVPRQTGDPRHSVAAYPTPEGDVVDAIPTWTQPVQKSGTWDDVVLPVVARKKGLDGQYEQADGSPRPKLPEATVIKPAPGTFGFDYSKCRRQGSDHHMDEFGNLTEVYTPEEKNPTLPPRKPSPQLPKSAKAKPSKENLSHTLPNSSVNRPSEVPTIHITRPSSDSEKSHKPLEDEDGAGGCCKCVIM